MSGIGTHVKHIIKGAIKNNYKKIIFLFSYQNEANEIKKLKNLNYSITFINALPFSLNEQLELKKFLKQHPNCIFHTPHFNVPFLHNKNIKRINTIHDVALDLYPEEIKSIVHKLYYKLCMKKIEQNAAVIAVSNFTKKTIEEKYNMKNISVIHNTFQPNQTKINEKNRKTNTLLFVGINKKRKNLKFLLNVMTRLPNNIKLLIIGSENTRQFNIDSTIKKLNLQTRVSRLGFISSKVLKEHYKTSTALIFPSLLEGFGYPILEAAANELPVIASNQSAIPEIGGKGCLYFNPKDQENCKQRIMELINSKELQLELIKENKKQLEKFNVTDGFKKLIQLYESLG